MSATNKQSLLDQLDNKSARVAILGLGYVGLPLAVVFSEAGFNVIGIDPDERKVNTICRGESHIQDIPNEQIARLVASGKLTATTDFSALEQAQAVSICVPTPLRKTGDPDLSFILDATNMLAKYMHPGMVIVLEVNHLPGHNPRDLAPQAGRRKRPEGRPGLLPGILPRTR